MCVASVNVEAAAEAKRYFETAIQCVRDNGSFHLSPRDGERLRALLNSVAREWANYSREWEWFDWVANFLTWGHVREYVLRATDAEKLEVVIQFAGINEPAFVVA
jgi:hypothetical protein